MCASAFGSWLPSMHCSSMKCWLCAPWEMNAKRPQSKTKHTSKVKGALRSFVRRARSSPTEYTNWPSVFHLYVADPATFLASNSFSSCLYIDGENTNIPEFVLLPHLYRKYYSSEFEFLLSKLHNAPLTAGSEWRATTETKTEESLPRTRVAAVDCYTTVTSSPCWLVLTSNTILHRCHGWCEYTLWSCRWTNCVTDSYLCVHADEKKSNAFILVVFHEISHHQHIFRTCLMKYKTNSLKVFILYDVTWLFSDLWHSDGVGQQMSQF